MTEFKRHESSIRLLLRHPKAVLVSLAEQYGITDATSLPKKELAEKVAEREEEHFDKVWKGIRRCKYEDNN